MKTLISSRFGSHLYGTTTPTSDTDFKAVHVPSADDILMMTTQAVVSCSTGSKETKNTADDIDDESFTLSKYFSMLKRGDMVAQELLHIPESFAEFMSDEWKNIILPNRNRLVDRNIKGFVGYIQRQCAVYGYKGTRVEAVRKFVGVLNNWSLLGLGKKIKDIPYFKETLVDLVKVYDCASFVMLPKANDNEEMEEYFELVNRKISYNIAVKEALNIFQKVLDSYGSRALAAETNQGVDWKSFYHAIRVSQQAIELLETGCITFPRPNVPWLLDVKQGKFHYKEIAEILENNLDKLLKLMKIAPLPEEIDHKFMDDVIHELHLNQVKQRYFIKSW